MAVGARTGQLPGPVALRRRDDRHEQRGHADGHHGDEFEQVALGITPCALDFGDDGRLFASADGQLMELEQIGGEWVYPPDPVFQKQAAGSFLHVSRNSTNFDPALHDNNNWFNIIPDVQGGESIPDCVADVNGDGDAGFPDLLAVLAAWSTSDPLADVDADLTVGFSDLLIVLSAWGPCD